jgi:predicted PurR-regulated permease PerM
MLNNQSQIPAHENTEYNIKILTSSFIIFSFFLLFFISGGYSVAVISAMLTYWWIAIFTDKGTRRNNIVAIFIITLALSLLLSFAVWVVFKHLITEQNISMMSVKIIETINEVRTKIPESLASYLPDTTDDLRAQAIIAVKENLTTIDEALKKIGMFFVMILAGIILGSMLSYHKFKNTTDDISYHLKNRVKSFYITFKHFVAAQFLITSINTVLASIYLLGVIPMLGYNIPFEMFLIFATFLLGFIPILGNLISNTIIAVVSLSVDFYLMIYSLGYLIVIHKFEYLLNAKIIGVKINASPWETILSMIIMERFFGMIGVVIAPIVYGWIKNEMTTLKLIK